MELHESSFVSLLSNLRSSTLYNELFVAAQEEAQKSNVRLSDLKKCVQSGLVSAGWDKKLRNAVYHIIQSQYKLFKSSPLASPESEKEPIAYILKAQFVWEKKILKSLNSMCTELTVPLARSRSEKDKKDLAARWSELGVDGPAKICSSDLSQIRPVYAPKDFLEVLVGLQNPNSANTGNMGTYDLPWGLIQVSLKVKTLNELRVQYSEMAITHCQTGTDDLPDIPPELFENERSKLGKKVIAANHAPTAREYSKRGCPVSMRADLWCQILGVDLQNVDYLYYEQLKSYVLQHDLLVDSLLYKDVKLTATNDDQYFVFEDFLYQVLLPFSRDSVVLKHFAYNSATPPKSYIRGKLGIEEFAVTYPPNGVIPFHGFAMYVAPLCYLYNDVVRLYYVFRHMYVNYFFRLHSVSSHPQGIVALSLLFEKLLQAEEPELFYHLIQVGCQPLKIAFKWLMRAFSGFLASDQVLLLWDRILAFDSMEILSVLAVAIFSFRKTNLLKVQCMSTAEAVLADLFTLQIVPLLQLSLFSK
ncbi:TBC1 domain family member 19-like isoform X1 [Biomphalaria glabrata]|uniref:TBC1 domain family member 19-like isoform X1 n=1 Tax=Biomphalaria glabrata TaxID=6526 RepID=A0A9U8E4G8_BIOGL|nr:TBC1 domain family member 19-like isoform X1 [Biomphalaria glabrata]XP_013072482.2 TBC1 domain family member 19-like isoform X1 [Biomphalaria glabrata]XP_013072483.2 TBC1 domain family member 19-like isoform X1 [Biomphalaria glabrata]XP_055894213.1 TBC1 domain family member 19-like isoform X1 [Biomphalaria glabrata]